MSFFSLCVNNIDIAIFYLKYILFLNVVMRIEDVRKIVFFFYAFVICFILVLFIYIYI